jgi:hypothetical protein
MDPRSWRGGSLKLRELIEEHPAELAYDLRSRFGFGIDEIGNKISLREAVLLVSILRRDPESWLQAAIADWTYPVSREWIVASHTYELLAAVNTKGKSKPYPTPWPQEGTNKIGSKKQATSDVLAQLERMNPKENDG